MKKCKQCGGDIIAGTKRKTYCSRICFDTYTYTIRKEASVTNKEQREEVIIMNKKYKKESATTPRIPFSGEFAEDDRKAYELLKENGRKLKSKMKNV